MEADKLWFGIVIEKSDNGLDRRPTFMILRCNRSGKYITSLHKLKRDDTGSRKCECLFKLCGYLLANNKWRFNVIFDTHNHDKCDKLVYRPIACHLRPEEKEIVSNMTLSMAQPQNILVTLKRKRPRNISNVKQVYNIHV